MFKVNGVKREYPNWNTRAKVRKVDEAGNVVQGQYGCGGELVRVSPRYQKNGTNYRIRPERPAIFFAAWAFEHGLLPMQLTPEECEQEDVLQLLEQLWEACKGHFPKLESPYAACDDATVPSLRVGFSFNIPQLLIESVGSVKPTPGTSGNSIPGPNTDLAIALRQKVDQLRARGSSTTPSKKK